MRNRKTLLLIFLALTVLLSSCTVSRSCGASEPQVSSEPVSSGPSSRVLVSQPSPTALLAPAGDFSGLLTVHFLDVGQADCILVRLPNAQTMLIDGGSRSSSQTVLDYLVSQGVGSIDFLVITHPHEDHIGGLPEVIDSFDIGEIYMPRVSHNTQIFERLLTAIQDNGYRINASSAGTVILSAPDLHIEIVAPVGDSYRELNNYSTVVRIAYGNVSFLFTGDAETVSENEITGDIRSDVLKVAHHGSDTSTSGSFLQRVDPSYAVIFVGANNSYGHPSQDVLARLLAAGVSVFRTDEAGTVVMTTDGVTIEIDTLEGTR